MKNYIHLANRIIEIFPKKTVTFILGEKEKKYIDIISKNNFRILFNANIEKLFIELSRSNLVISNDCGPGHIAQLSACRYIILFSDEKNDADKVIAEWFNPRKGCHAIKGERNKNINTISVETVFNAACKALFSD